MRINNNLDTIRLVIADDHPMLRNGLQYMFSLNEEFSVVAAVANGLELVKAVKEHKPHVALTDLKMQEMDGPQACAQIKQDNPETDIIVYSMYDSEELIRQMRGMGVKGYLLKSGDGNEVCKAVHTVYNGGEYYSASIRTRTNQLFQNGKLGRGTTEMKQEFSATELQIIRLICQENCTKEIADKLKIKERTIQAHKEGIEEKMNVRGVVGIAVYAITNWLLH
jgi:two-component system nitrate/nitrite response regulator NarL